MDFLCYLHPGWEPLIRPAPSTRAWMDATPEAFAYRCLPLNIANAHGWEILSPCDVSAYWTGGARTEDVVVRQNEATAKPPVSIFGQGVLTFHVEGLFRTPPGWDLWIGGSPNHPTPGLQPLTGVVETDWSPYTFTMNWKFTRRNHWVRIRKNDPICFVFPTPRGALEAFAPKLVPLAGDSDLVAQFHAWSRSRDDFQREMADGKHRAPTEKWQKRYYRGVTMRDEPPVADHRARLRLPPFVPGAPAEAAEEIGTLDEARLAALLAAVARDARAGRGETEIAATLARAGIPPAMAARLAAATRPAEAEGEAR